MIPLAFQLAQYPKMTLLSRYIFNPAANHLSEPAFYHYFNPSLPLVYVLCNTFLNAYLLSTVSEAAYTGIVLMFFNYTIKYDYQN